MAAATTPESIALIGEAPSFVAMLEHVSRAAKLSKPVLVIGERGTGKELIASRLHYLSPRWEQPLIKVNCAALTETLLESELFGHQAGAFTGATRTHIGKFEQANGGTLVLDELGRFRADLLDRLAFDVIHVPPLRARPEDIETLAYHFAVNVTSELKRPYFAGFTADATAALLGYRWPGNVRELKNAVERSVYRTDDAESPISKILFDPFVSPYGPLPTRIEQESPEPQAALPAHDDFDVPSDFRSAVTDFEKRVLKRALERAQFKQTTAAKLLGLSYHQLRSLLRKHGMAKAGGSDGD